MRPAQKFYLFMMQVVWTLKYLYLWWFDPHRGWISNRATTDTYGLGKTKLTYSEWIKLQHDMCDTQRYADMITRQADTVRNNPKHYQEFREGSGGSKWFVGIIPYDWTQQLIAKHKERGDDDLAPTFRR